MTYVNIVSPLSISKYHSEKVQVFLDSRVASSTELLAFHPSDETKTVFITVKELQEHLSSTDVKVTEIDFMAAIVPGYDLFFRLMCRTVGKVEAKRATTKPAKEDAKIEGAALIGIDVRKDLDFPNWYQQVLTKGDMVFPPTLLMYVA